jgi:hypothetical protein
VNVVTVKPGVEFAVIAPGGFCILSAIQQASQHCAVDLTITSGTDGEHSGPADPHHTGNAYDVRSHDLTDEMKQAVLAYMMDTVLGWDRFYGFIEAAGTDNEHFHVQVKKGTTYP